MRPRSPARALLCAALATGALLFWTAVRPPRAGEPLPLRWARTAASHPLRTGLALALLVLGLRPPRAPDPSRRDAAQGAARGQGLFELR